VKTVTFVASLGTALSRSAKEIYVWWMHWWSASERYCTKSGCASEQMGSAQKTKRN